MALQILARLPKSSTSLQKIKAINDFIFYEMRFRFPPHSLWPKDVDTYTLLPAVMDNRQGVCLGVSILYLSLAQRLDLPLIIITPPGHIFLAFENKEQLINIETTARGIHLPSEVYLGINTKKLLRRTLKEVVGMAFMNEAAIHLQNKNYEKAKTLYEKALPYNGEDPLLHMLLGLTYLFVNNETEGKKHLQPLLFTTFEEAVTKEAMIEDLLSGNANLEGIEAIFLPVDENRTSIIKKQGELKKILQKTPHFRDGLLQLAITYLQLSRSKEALDILRSYVKIDDSNPTVQYYLSMIYLNRSDYPSAWEHFRKAEKLTNSQNHYPRCLKELRKTLQRHLPEKAF